MGLSDVHLPALKIIYRYTSHKTRTEKLNL